MSDNTKMPATNAANTDKSSGEFNVDKKEQQSRRHETPRPPVPLTTDIKAIQPQSSTIKSELNVKNSWRYRRQVSHVTTSSAGEAAGTGQRLAAENRRQWVFLQQLQVYGRGETHSQHPFPLYRKKFECYSNFF